jgi:transposase
MAPTVPLFVGLDYSQKGVPVCVLDATGRVLSNQNLSDNAAGIAAHVYRHGAVRGCALAACCGAADLAEELVERHGWPVPLAHPAFVSRLKQSPDKTAFSDARVLADLERVGYLPRVWITPKARRDLRTLVRERQSLVNQRRARKLQSGAFLGEHRQRCGHGCWTKAWLHWREHQAHLPEQTRWVLEQRLRRLGVLGQEIQRVEARLATLTNDDQMVQWLDGLKGIGPVTAWTLRAEVGRFDRFRIGKQLACYCGLSPCNRSSGDKQADAGLIRAANSELRRVWIEAAWGLINHDPRWRAFAQRLAQRGKPRSVISAAVANRFVRWLWHQGMQQPAA